MNKSLVKILAISTIAISLGACTKKPVPVERTIAEIFSLAADGKFEHEGELITLKETCVYGNYGNTYIVGVAYEQGETILDNKGFEVEFKKVPDWQGETKGRYANVDVTGTLTNVNGRPVFKNATAVINAEARYNEDGSRVDDDGAFSAGYWPTSVTKRSYWDEYLGRGMNGTLMEGIFQLASVPSAVSATAGSEFYVVFPGENTDATDAENDSLIYVNIPAGLNETATGKINEFFTGKKAGDFVDMMAISRYDSEKGGMGYILENWWAKYIAAPKAADIPDVFASWTEVAEACSELYDDFVDLSSADASSALNAPFSYVVDASNYSKNPKDYWVEAYQDILVTVKDPEDCGTTIITANFKASNADAYYEALEAKLEAEGFVLDEVKAENPDLAGYYIFEKKSGDDVVAEMMLEVHEAQCVMFYTAKRAAEITPLQAAVAAVDAKLAAVGLTGMTDYTATYGFYYKGVNLGAPDEGDTLKLIADAGAYYFLPDGFTLASEEADTVQGVDYWCEYYLDATGTILIEIDGSIQNGNCTVEIYVAENAPAA